MRTLLLRCLPLVVLASCHHSSSGGSSIPPGPQSKCAVLPSGGSTATYPPCPPGAVNPSVYSVDSNPQGLTVTVNSASAGVTPTTVSVASVVSATTVTIAPPANSPSSPYSYQVQQTSDGAHLLYVNYSADTSGGIANVASASLRGQALSFTAPDIRRHPLGTPAGKPAIDTAHLAVFYRATASALSLTGPSAREQALGVARAYTLGPVQNQRITRVLSVPAGETVDTLAAKFQAEPDVLAVARVRRYYALGYNTVTPNDPHFNVQWYLQRDELPYAWNDNEGAAKVPIAIIDTGFDTTSPDLTGKVTYAESDDNGTVSVGNGFVKDLVGHGTNVSGLAGAQTNNGSGFAGVGWKTLLMEFKVFFPDPSSSNGYAEPSASSTDTAQAIYDAIARGARVINLSLGITADQGVDPVLRDAVAFALNNNVVVVAAAGNESNPTLDYPAAFDGVISVGASGIDDGNTAGGGGTPAYSPSFPDLIAPYTNYSPQLTLVAPGGIVYGGDQGSNPDLLHWIVNLGSTQVADPTLLCTNQSDCVSAYEGTSQATPQVSGTAALMLSLNNSLSAAQVKSVLQSTADDTGDPRQGGGRLNAYRALAALKGAYPPPSLPANTNFVAFAYTPSGSAQPQILDRTFTRGVPVNSDGSFRVPDIPAGASGYKIGVWYNANGTGTAGVGDWFASTPVCVSNAGCAGAGALVAHPVGAGFTFN